MKLNWKKLFIDILVDIIGGMLIAVGVYNFALYADFPVAGFTGISLILYHLFSLPIGIGTIILNIPVSILCYKYLGKAFFFTSIKTMIISSLLIDYVAPLLPVYTGSRLLAALCMGVLSGAGLAMIFMRGSSTGGQDFVTLALKKARPHITLGFLTLILDTSIILIGSIFIFKEIDGFIYGTIVTYLMATVMDKMIYGTNEGKMSLIITDFGEEIAEQIEHHTHRGSTLLKGMGCYSKKQKDIILCACSNKEMYKISKAVKYIDPNAFTIIVKSNEVVGEGFKEDLTDL